MPAVLYYGPENRPCKVKGIRILATIGTEKGDVEEQMQYIGDAENSEFLSVDLNREKEETENQRLLARNTPIGQSVPTVETVTITIKRKTLIRGTYRGTP